jgi:ParB family chromosome partitioning protein
MTEETQTDPVVAQAHAEAEAAEEATRKKKNGPNGGNIVAAPSSKIFLLDPDDPQLKIVGLDTDHKEGEHPLYDRRINLPLNEMFVQYMMMPDIGFDSVITVKKDGDDILVVKGRQRVRTAREANKRLKKAGRTPLRIKCEFSRGDSDETSLAKKFGENAHRENDKPIETARNLHEFITSGRTDKEASIVFRMTEQNVRMLLKLLELDPSIQKAVQRGEVAASSVAPLAELSRADQKVAFDKLKEDAATGVKVTHKVAKATAKAKKKGDSEVIVAPGKRLVTKILDLNKAEGSPLDPMFVKGVLWVLGDVSTKGVQVKGLTALETAAKGGKD